MIIVCQHNSMSDIVMYYYLHMILNVATFSQSRYDATQFRMGIYNELDIHS